jgi:translation initiation factor 3 subunit I
MRLWSVQTGKCLFVWEFPTAVKRVTFSDDDEQVVCITEQRMGHQGAIRIFNISRDDDGTHRAYQSFSLPFNPTYLSYLTFVATESQDPVSMFHPVGSKATVCAFPYMPGMILTGHESGKVALFDADTGEEILSNERAHMDVVSDLQLSADRSYFITSSKDKTARIHDTKTLTVLKTFQTETPLNSAALTPNLPYVRGSVFYTRSFDEMCLLLPPTAHSLGPTGRRSRSHERHDDITTTGEI